MKIRPFLAGLIAALTFGVWAQTTDFKDYPDTSTPIMAAWLNDIDRLHYDILGDPATASDIRTAISVDVAGTDNSTNVSLTGTPDYITITGQVITRNQIDLTADVTGTLPVANLPVTGADAAVVSGTAGTSGNCAQWNVDGDLVDAGAACGTGTSAFNDITTGTNTTATMTVGTGASLVTSGTGTITASGVVADGVDEASLKAVDTAADEECLTYEVTTGDFEWQSCGAGGGDNILIDGVGVTDPDFVSTGDIDFVDTTNTVTANINDGTVEESHLNAVDAPADEECLTYEATGTQFEWQTCGGGGSSAFNDITTGTNTTATMTVGAGASLEMTGTGEIEATHSVRTVRNESGGTLNKCDVVYVSGYSVGSDLALVDLADADGASTYPAIGLVEDATIGNNADGKIVTNGRLSGCDTSAFTAGDGVFLSTTAGAFSTRPTANDVAVQKLGIVLRSNATLGVIELVGAGRSNDVPNEHAIGLETVWIPAGSMLPTVSNGSASLATVQTTAGQPDLHVLDFDSTVDEHAQFEWAFPKRWDNSTVTYRVFWTTSATGTTGVAWGLQGTCIGDNEAIADAYGTAVVVTDDAQSAANEQLITGTSTAVTLADSTGRDMCYFRMFRDVSDANDDMAEDARLIGIKLFWTANAANDD